MKKKEDSILKINDYIYIKKKTKRILYKYVNIFKIPFNRASRFQ